MADHGHSKDKSTEKKRSPHLAMPIVIGIGLLLAVGVIIIAVMSRGGSGDPGDSADPVDQTTGASDERPSQGEQRVEYKATPTEYLPMPKKSSGQWAEVPNRPHWTNCTGSKDGIETQYRAQPGGDWLPAKPSSTVYRWRYRSVDETERVLDRNWDTNPNCSTPVPS